ncbi:SDR family NAD(P)-dependent oxidoreductase [Chloroflexota bacterium]
MSLPSFSLEGKVAIVTGAKRGIGKAIALTFAEAGADVAVCSRVVKDGLLETTAKEIKRSGRRSLAIQTDIRLKDDVDNLIDRVVDEFGAIDILVNNAGVDIDGKPLLEFTEEDWNTTFDTDLKGYFLCCQAVGKRMIKNKKGNIINMSAVSGLKPRETNSLYAIAQAGVIMLTRAWALELASYNVRVNAIAPFWVKTENMEARIDKDPELLKIALDATPLGYLSGPSDIASSALFLASDASRYITGHTLCVDGGKLA